MGGYLSHFVPAQQSDVATQINVIEDGHKEFLYCMLEHICLCVVKEYLDGDGPGGKLRSFPVLRGESSGAQAARHCSPASLRTYVRSYVGVVAVMLP